tara:strand:- start:986 stop:1342 length:357 start_codon:yes stop_codon:yes gene_type:complete
MGQRINITYSIDINELQSEVGRLWKSTKGKVASLQTSDLDEEYILEHRSLDMIQKMRQQIADIDYCLMDIASIVLSYNNHRSEQMVKSDDETEDNNLDDLQNKLERFKESISPDEIST